VVAHLPADNRGRWYARRRDPEKTGLQPMKLWIAPVPEQVRGSEHQRAEGLHKPRRSGIRDCFRDRIECSGLS
jgi:hypothetical protein